MRVDGEVEAEGLSFAYREWGVGPTVLLLHGFPDSPSTFTDLGEKLASRGYRAIAPWMRGYGPTGGSVRNLGQLARDVLALADAFEQDQPVSVVGHDWGAVAGCMAATLRPEQLERLVMLGLPHPAHFLNTVFGDPAQLRRSWYIWLFQLQGLPESALAAEDYVVMDGLWTDWSPNLAQAPHRDEIVETFDTGGVEGPISYYRSIFAEQAGNDPNDDALYGPVATPTLSLMGEHDGCISPDFLVGQELYWCSAVASYVMKDCGHFLHIERPDLVGELVGQFLGKDDIRTTGELLRIN